METVRGDRVMKLFSIKLIHSFIRYDDTQKGVRGLEELALFPCSTLCRRTVQPLSMTALFGSDYVQFVSRKIEMRGPGSCWLDHARN